jgi:hypothetical protein
MACLLRTSPPRPEALGVTAGVDRAEAALRVALRGE